MDTLAAGGTFLFEGFCLDLRAGGLFRADENGVLVRVPIGSRALDLLILLVRRHGDLVSKDEIMTAVWPGMIVEDSNLPTQISALRRALDRGRSTGSCIQTVAGRGYRFVAAITDPPPAEARSVGSPLHSDAPPSEAGAPESIADLPGLSLPIEVSRHRSTVSIAIAAAVGAALALGIGACSLSPMTKPAPAPEMVAAGPVPQPLVAPRLSIVVLPFANLNNDPEQRYFADAVTEDLTTNLSRISGSFVISRNTAFTYRDRAVDTKQIGRELGVRYVLEGSIRRSGNQIRINAQLIDAETDAHLWAERFNGDTSDLFVPQDEITSRIAATLSLELVRAEAARPTQHPRRTGLSSPGTSRSCDAIAREPYGAGQPVRARIGARSTVRRDTEPVGDRARGPRHG